MKEEQKIRAVKAETKEIQFFLHNTEVFLLMVAISQNENVVKPTKLD